jgi:hypothetical protein
VADITVSVSSPGILGFGQSTWNTNSWGGDSLSASFSIGGVEFVFANGWGSNLWGQFTYGIVGDVAAVTGSQINLSINSVTAFTDVLISLTGQQLNTNITGVTTTADANTTISGLGLNTVVGNSVGEPGNFADVTGSRINLTPGTVTTDIQPNAGWGVKGWGIVPWGLEDDVIASVTGTALSVVTHPVDIQIDGNIFVNVDEDDDIIIYLNSVTTIADANVSITGSRLNIAEGLAGAVISADANVSITGSQLNTVAGQAVGGTITPVDVTGSQINVLIGNETTSADATVTVTGSRINLTPGDVNIDFVYDVTGSRINTLINSVTVTGNAIVDLTGIRLNTAVGSVNITAWAEVQTGASNTWTPVDLAA